MIWKDDYKPYREGSLFFPLPMNKKTKKATDSQKSVKSKVEWNEDLIDLKTWWPDSPSTELEPEADVQIVEKIVYKRERVHWFFRTLTLLVLLVIGFLLFGESMGIAKVTISNFSLDTIYPIVIIFSTIVIRSYRGLFGKLFGVILFLGVFGWFFTIRTYNWLNEDTPDKFGEPVAFEMTGWKKETINIKTLVGDIDIEWNTKSPYLQGTRTSDRDMISKTSTSGAQETMFIQDDNTLNLLQDFVSHLTLYVPAKTDFQDIYVRNAWGTENINTQDLSRHKMTFHGGVNRIVLDINDISAKTEIEIQGVIQDITINIPKEIGVMMQYRNRIGYKTVSDIDYQTWHLYASTNIDTAKKILTLKVNTFVGKFKINRK